VVCGYFYGFKQPTTGAVCRKGLQLPWLACLAKFRNLVSHQTPKIYQMAGDQALGRLEAEIERAVQRRDRLELAGDPAWQEVQKEITARCGLLLQARQTGEVHGMACYA
jgi:hypothetical protein